MTKTQKKREEPKNSMGFTLRTVIFFIISAIICCSFFFNAKLENFINFQLNKNAPSTTISADGVIVHFINVGQADAIFVEFPTGENMLIDTGLDTDSSTMTKAESLQNLQNYLNSIDFEIEGGEKVLDYLILTHPHEDHIAGAEYIFETYKVKTCYRPNVYASNEDIPVVDLTTISQSSSETYADVITAIENEGCTSIKTIQGLTIKSEGYIASTASTDAESWIIDFYAPIADELPYLEPTEGNSLNPNANNYSPIMILSYMGKKIMLTGDAETRVEVDFIQYYESSEIDFDVDILKLGHHGSKGSSTEDFLSFVAPEYVIISCGTNNSYDHPDNETLERLEIYELPSNNIYRTDLNGNIAVGISEFGTISLEADHVQYSTIELKWWYFVVGGIVVVGIIIYTPYIVKAQKIAKKAKKRLKIK